MQSKARANSSRPRPRHRHRAATSVEYCFALSLILMAVLLAVKTFGVSLDGIFVRSNEKLESVGITKQQ
jgi:Flp pilus assembly pilin Flp